MFESEIEFIKKLYPHSENISLHEPKFIGNEKKYLNHCIDSNFVSSVGEFVDTFESKIAEYTGSKFAVATSNGTSAIHLALLSSDVHPLARVPRRPRVERRASLRRGVVRRPDRSRRDPGAGGDDHLGQHASSDRPCHDQSLWR